MRLVSYAAATAALIVAVLGGSARAALADDPVTIFPNPSAPGTSTTFQVDCSSESAAEAADSATLEGTTLGLAAQIPMQSDDAPNVFVTTVVLPSSIAPGSYNPDIDCSNGVTASATLTVNPVPSPAPPTGDGTTSTATNAPLIYAGLGLLGFAAVIGGLAWRRGRAGHRS